MTEGDHENDVDRPLKPSTSPRPLFKWPSGLRSSFLQTTEAKYMSSSTVRVDEWSTIISSTDY
ncbi:hypothetical protein CHS0354_014006 [Potamilus streckersoni]|uniref:Uncharacterized protein n=1 Tax=Potamilus streckersoni TaxID=2493646 RepID=A0AAE0TL26_9BIVA|nr:hypothetical protein CHS0354_014006 [Potamilus streckersoni]